MSRLRDQSAPIGGDPKTTRWRAAVDHRNRFRSNLVLTHIGICLLCLLTFAAQTSAQTPDPVATISAASFTADLAPDSIVASFGVGLATGTAVAATNPLPTELLGTLVTIRDANGKDHTAQLLFVSPGQINFIFPAQAAAGAATVSIRSGSGKTSIGPVQVSTVAPGIFTANQDGTGAPAATVLRVLPNGSQVLESASITGPDNRFIPRSIDLGAANEQVFLILFLTGLRKAPATDGNPQNGSAENVQVLIGGAIQQPLYAGAQGSFAGLDQLNLQVPRSLLDPTSPGSKRLEISVKVVGFSDSNKVAIVLATPAAPPLQISGVNAPTQLIVNSVIELNGTGISLVPEKNQINFGEDSGDPRPGQVKNISATQLSVVVPFGALSGQIALNSDGKRWTSLTRFSVQTSFSAVLKDTEGQVLSPVIGARICFPDCNPGSLTTTVQTGGWFVLPGPPVGARRVFVIEPVAQNTALPFNRTLVSSQILGDRDNHLPQDVYLQAIYGPTGLVGGSSGFAGSPSDLAAAALELSIQGFRFSLPAGATSVFPGGGSTGSLTLTPVKNSLTPVPLPPNIFSSSIVQISPFGVKLAPGGKLVFPNTDALQGSPLPSLYKYDLSSAVFIDTGIKGLVSADGKSVETPAGSITETSIYLVAVPQQTTTIVGRVFDSDGQTPIRGAAVLASGRQTTSDGNGGFSLENVPTAPRGSTSSGRADSTRRTSQNTIPVSASYLRPSGRTDTAQKVVTDVVVGGVSNLGSLVLSGPNSNRPPSIYVPGFVALYVTEVKNIPVLVLDPDTSQTIVSAVVSGGAFASIINNGNGSFTLRLTPQASDAGSYGLTIRATDSSGGARDLTFTVLVHPFPVANALAVVTKEDTPVAIPLTSNDAAGAALTYTVLGQPTKGTLTGTPPNLNYTPAANFNGSDFFSFKVSNGVVESASATVTIKVDPVNDPPVLSFSCGGSLRIFVGETGSCLLTASDVDGDQSFVFSALELPPGAQFDASQGLFTWTPTVAQAGFYAVTFMVSDSGNPPLSATRPLTIIVSNTQPILGMLSPPSAIAGAPALSLTVTGSGFVEFSQVNWNGLPRTTTFIDSMTLNATIPASDLAFGGLAQVTVFNPLPGGGTSAPVIFTINNPLPVLSGLVPNSAQAGDLGFLLMVNGLAFVPGSIVQWNGSPRVTNFVNSTQLTASVLASDLVLPGTATVTVFSPAPGGGLSAGQGFLITDPTLIISGLLPPNTPVGGPAFDLTVNGSTFVPLSMVRWNGMNRATTFGSPNQLTATITMADIAVGGIFNVTVVNPGPGSPQSAPFPFSVVNPLPVLGSVVPDMATTGDPGQLILVIGSSFVSDSIVLWNGNPRATIFLSPNQLQATIPAADFAVGAIANVTVQNATPGGGTSAPQPFTIRNPVPVAISLVPNSGFAGDPAFTITVNGSNFVPNSVVRWNGSPRATNFVNANQLTAMILASDLSTAGTANVTVFNPAPGGAESAIVLFAIDNPVPVINNLLPPSTGAGGPAFVLTVNGLKFVNGAIVRWNGSDRPTTFGTFSQLTAMISATDIQNAVVVEITVLNPPPGGGLSNVVNFVIAAPIVAPGSTATAEEFSSEWTPTGQMNTPRSGLVATMLANGQVLITGGVAESGLTTSAPALNDVELFDPQSGLWKTLRNMHFTRAGHSATFIVDADPLQSQGGWVLVVGGLGTDGRTTAARSAELFDSTTGFWRKVIEPHFAHIKHSATQLTDGRVLIAGGEDESGGATPNVEIYDPREGVWLRTGTLNSPRAGHTAVMLHDGRVLVVGGWSAGGALASAEIYDPTTRVWTPTPSLNFARSGHTSTVLLDGTVLVTGGGSARAGSNPEVFDPWIGAWTRTGPLGDARFAHTATLRSDGSVIVGGGQMPGGDLLDVCELFDPTTRVWSKLPRLNQSRSGHTALLLLDGRILVAGGTAGARAGRDAEPLPATQGSRILKPIR